MKWHELQRKPDGTTEDVPRYKSTGSTDRKFAQGVLRSELMALGGRPVAEINPQKVTYEQVRDNFLAYEAEQKRRSLKWKDGKPTLDTIPRLDKLFGGQRVADISLADLKRFRAACKAKGNTDARVNRYMATLRAMVRRAVKEELLTSREVPPYFPMVSEPNVAVGAVFAEPQWYVPLRKKLPEPLRSAFTLAYHTALRVGELQKLRWRDFDLRKHEIRLPGEITKTAKPRTVWVPSDFDLRQGDPDALVFDLGDYRMAWRKACLAVGAGWYTCKECGEVCDGRRCPTHGMHKLRDDGGLRYHGLLLRHSRHTAARNLSDAGLPEARIMGVTGHQTRAMFDRYNIGRTGDTEKAREAAEAHHKTEQEASEDAA